MSQRSFSFPVLKGREVLEVLGQIEVMPALTKEDIKSPTPEVVESVYRSFVVLLTGVSEYDLDAHVEFVGLDAFEHREIHERSVPRSNFVSKLTKLMEIVGVDDFSIRDLAYPVMKRFVIHISGLINYTRFRANQQEILMKINQENETLLQDKSRLEGETEQLREKVDYLEKEKKESDDFRSALDNEVDELGIKLREEGSHMEKIAQTLTEKREELDTTLSKLNDVEGNVDQLRKQASKLKSQIVEDPQQLVDDLEHKSESVAAKKKTIASKRDELHDLQAFFDDLSFASNKVNKRIEEMKECEADLEKLKAYGIDMKEVQSQIKSYEQALAEVASSEAYVKSQISKTYGKMCRHQKQFETKFASAQKALKEAQAKQREAMEKQVDDTNKAKQLRVMIAQKEEKIERLKQHHQNNMELLWTKFNHVKTQVLHYRKRVESTMAAFS